jgi:hypothetical protein
MFERSPRGAERPPAPFSRDPEERKLEVALSRVLFPCHDEYMVSNRKRPMYWDTEDDIIFFQGMQGPLREDIYLAETACIWSYHGFSSPEIKGVKNFAMEFDYFARWILSRARDPFEETETFYVILKRRSTDGEEDWSRHKTRFMCCYQQLKADSPSKFIGGWKPKFHLRIVQSIERVLHDGAFEAAVSEHDIGGWKDDPNVGRWAPNEEPWRE